jgi:hypothetical protein
MFLTYMCLPKEALFCVNALNRGCTRLRHVADDTSEIKPHMVKIVRKIIQCWK